MHRNRRRLSTQHLERRNLLVAHLSEIVLDPLFGDADTGQYIEIRGEASATLPEHTYLAIVEERGRDVGVVEELFDLSNLQFGTNGYLVLMQQDSPYVEDPDNIVPGANVLTSIAAGFDGLPGDIYSDVHPSVERIDFIHESNGFLLVQAAGPITLGLDIDADDDGQIDPLIAASLTIHDSISLHPFVGRGDVAYGDIVFAERGSTLDQDVIIPRREGVELVVTEGAGYAARVGESVGSTASDWVFSTIEDETRYQHNSVPARWALSDSLFGEPSRVFLMGKDLDHIGGPNFVAGARGHVFNAGEPLDQANVFLDYNGNGVHDAVTYVIDPDEVVDRVNPPDPIYSGGGPHLINAWPGVTLSDWALNSFPSSNITAESESPFGDSENEIFSSNGIDFFTESSRLRFDFLHPIQSASIEAIGNRSPLTRSIGRINGHNADGDVIATAISDPLGDGQRQRIELTSQEPIVYVTAYSDDDLPDAPNYNLSPFGMFDRFTYTQMEPADRTDENGFYSLTHSQPGSFELVAGWENLVAGNQTLSFTRYDNYEVDFGLRENQGPLFGDVSLSVVENAAVGTAVGVVEATDPEGLEVTYRLDEASVGFFEVDRITGEIFVGEQADFNFEFATQDAVTVLAIDQTGLATRQTFPIAILDVNEPPTIVNPTLFINEDADLSTVIGPLVSEDPEGHAVQMTLLTTDGPFAMTPSGYFILGQALDYQVAHQHDLTIQLTDNGTPAQTSEVVVRVEVIDQDSPPTLVDMTIDINENSPPESFVVTIESSDSDGGPEVRYEIIGGPAADQFAIDTSTGELRLREDAVLDHEVLTTLSVEIGVFVGDSDTPADTSLFQLRVGDVDEPPRVEGIIADGATMTGERFAMSVNDSMTVSDPDNDDAFVNLSIRRVDGPMPAWLSFDASTGMLQGLASSIAIGTMTLQLVATDIDDPTLFSSIEFTLDVSPSQTPLFNPSRPTDANGDDRTTALDALTVINHLVGPTADQEINAATRLDTFLDINGDNRVTALDALVVINYLVRDVDDQAGEGETVDLWFTEMGRKDRHVNQMGNLETPSSLF